MYTGFCEVEVPPSPKSHDQLSAFVDRSVKTPVRSTVIVSNAAMVLVHPPNVTVIFEHTESEPQELATVKQTVYVPLLLYVYTGFATVAWNPSPKSHRYDVTFKELFVNVTVRSVAVCVNDATGTVSIVTVMESV